MCEVKAEAYEGEGASLSCTACKTGCI